jgi:hypothetical protein
VGPSRFSCLLSILLGAVPTLALTGCGEATYHGTVVDAETKAPLEGAVVAVIWHRKPLVTMNGPQYFHRAREVLTDAEGKFAVNAAPGIDWFPFTYVVREPRVVIFKPGYGPFPVAQVSPRVVMRFGEQHQLDLVELNRELLKGAVVALPKLKTAEELREFSNTGALLISALIPDERIPNVIRLLNVHRKELGLPPYPGSFEGRRNP